MLGAAPRYSRNPDYRGSILMEGHLKKGQDRLAGKCPTRLFQNSPPCIKNLFANDFPALIFFQLK